MQRFVVDSGSDCTTSSVMMLQGLVINANADPTLLMQKKVNFFKLKNFYANGGVFFILW